MRGSVAGQEAVDRHQQRGAVELVGVEGLRVGLRAPRSSRARGSRRGSRRARPPTRRPSRVLAERRRELDRAVERDPAQHLRGQVVARLAAHLPDARVLLAPAARRRVGELGHEALDLRVQLAEPLAVEVERVEQLAVDVELDLVPGAVADAHRRRVAPAAQVGEHALGQVVLAADAVHDLQRLAAAAGRARHERDELLRLVGARADVQRLERQARVADPREAVVPVALAADGLGQRGRRGGDDRAGRPVRQALQHARAVAHQVAVRALVDVVLGLPGAPRLDDVVDARGDRAGRGRPRRVARRSAAPNEREPERVARAHGERSVHGRRPASSSGAASATSSRLGPPNVFAPPSITRISGRTSPYSGRGASSTRSSTVP